MSENCSIIILGGGPAGLATALALRKYGFEVTILEASAYDNYRAGEHIIPEGMPLLNELLIPKAVWESNSIKCYEVQSAWGGEDIYTKDSICNPYGEGVLLSRPAFDKDLAAFVNSKGVSLEVKARVNHLEKSDKGWLVEYRHGGNHKKMFADFVIDATGRNTKFASVFGIEKIRYDNLIGITIFCRPKKKEQVQKGSILVEAVEKGWWYSAVLMDDTLVATFATDADIARKTGTLENRLQYFIGSSNETKRILARYQRIGKVHTVSAKSQILTQLVGNNWMAVGDAAWSIDFLSSQGIYKAMAMGLKAANAIYEFYSGGPSALKNYENHFRDMFFTYIKLRAKYYRMETRWCDEDFWKKRQEPCWLEKPIVIDPNREISYSYIDYSDKKDYLKSVVPSVDENLLSSILESSASPSEAVTNYRKQSSHNSEDREIIIAIQELMNF